MGDVLPLHDRKLHELEMRQVQFQGALDTGNVRFESIQNSIQGLVTSIERVEQTVESLASTANVTGAKVDELRVAVTSHHEQLKTLFEARTDEKQKAGERRRLFVKLAFPGLAALGGFAASAVGKEWFGREWLAHFFKALLG